MFYWFSFLLINHDSLWRYSTAYLSSSIGPEWLQRREYLSSVSFAISPFQDSIPTLKIGWRKQTYRKLQMLFVFLPVLSLSSCWIRVMLTDSFEMLPNRYVFMVIPTLGFLCSTFIFLLDGPIVQGSSRKSHIQLFKLSVSELQNSSQWV